MGAFSPSFLQSFGIIAREGFEVVLLIGAMLAVARKSGAGERLHGLWWGAGLAAVASIVLALLADLLFRSAEDVELLEGATLLVAATVLLWVGHWLLAKVDVARWQAYVRSKVRSAAGRGSTFALAAIAFVAVFREGVETVLFYRALLADGAAPSPVLAGFAIGLALLALLCYAIYRFGLRIPLKPFFAATSALLLLLAFTFAGKGLHELQEAGALSETDLSVPGLPVLGVYPTVETLVGQTLVALAILIPAVYTWSRSRPPAEAHIEEARETVAG